MRKIFQIDFHICTWHYSPSIVIWRHPPAKHQYKVQNELRLRRARAMQDALLRKIGILDGERAERSLVAVEDIPAPVSEPLTMDERFALADLRREQDGCQW